VEEFVDGVSLDELIRRERYLPSDMALLIFRDCCKALKYAHDKNVVHRDIKPANILISRRGEVKLVDFGIAATQEEDEKALTRAGMTLGTPSYMPPEQISDTKSVDKRADIYSLGVMLYEMVTGKKAFPGGFTPETLSRIQKGKYRAPRKVNPRVSSTANTIIRRAVRPKPRRRYQDLDDVFRILNLTIRDRDPLAAQQCIRDYVDKKDAGGAKRRRPPGLRTALITVGLVAAAAAAAGAFLYQQGMLHEWFAAGEYGALIVSAAVAKGSKEPEQIFVQAVVNREERNENTRLDAVRLVFRENRELETADTFVLQSQKVYLKSDHYRIKVALESKVFWETLFLEPRTLQRLNPDTEAAHTVRVVWEDLPQLPLAVRCRVVDEASGADITGGTDLSVYLDGEWRQADRFVLSRLTTDNVYRFRFEREGYFTKLYHLIIRPEQTVLDFQVALIPRPGKLRIGSDAEGIRLRLNGSDTYLSGGESMAPAILEPTTEEVQELSLLPGDYLLTAEKSKKLTRDILVTIRSDRTVEVDIGADSRTRTLDLTIRGGSR